MTNDALVEALLKANVRLTEQLVSLAQSVIASAQQPVPAFVGTPQLPDKRMPEMSTLDDWSDIAGPDGNPFKSTPMHVPEYEEDARFALAQKRIDANQLSEILEHAGAINTEITPG